MDDAMLDQSPLEMVERGVTAAKLGTLKLSRLDCWMLDMLVGQSGPPDAKRCNWGSYVYVEVKPSSGLLCVLVFWGN